MKTNLKKSACILIATIAVIASCKKSETSTPSTNTTPLPNTDNYTSMVNFFAKNGVAAQTYTITNAAGGTFTTPQGTVVTIPANTFVNSLNQQVTGTVTITFKDIYKKSDMLLSNMPTNTITGAPLKSAGEFLIKATSAGTAVNLANTITVKQPLNGLPADSNMRAFVKADSSNNRDTLGWALANYDANLYSTVSGYVFSFYRFSYPVDSGTCCNSDNSSYFAAYPQTTLTIQQSDTVNYNTYVFLLFKGLNALVLVDTKSSEFTLYDVYAPLGLQCTIVTVGVKAGKLYSSFTPITISANQTVNFSMTETSTAAFEAAVKALD